MMRFWSLTIVAATALSIAGCTTGPEKWQKPGMTSDQWAVDHASCRSRARKLADDEYQNYSSHMGSGGVDNSAGFSAAMRNYDAKRNMQGIYDRCLRRKGYSKPAFGKA